MNHFSENRAYLDRLVAQAEQAVDADAYSDAVDLLSMAATFAWENHTGVFLDRRSEFLVARIARHVNEKFPVVQRCTASVAFLMTSIHPYGGHSKITWRWMQLDQGNTFQLVLVAQKQSPVPEQLTELVSGGRVRCAVLSAEHDVLQRIRDARDQLAGAGVLVMNIHPDDAVGAIAAACLRELLPIIYIDHAFFSFSLGMSSARVLCSTSPAAVAIATQERLVSPEHLVWYRNSPEWLGRHISSDSRALRERLGVPVGAPLLLSSGTEHKYYPVRGRGLLDLVAPLLERKPETHLVVLGILRPERLRTPALECLAERIHLLQPVSERELLRHIAACDVYLDAVPNHSGGAAQQAMMLAKPTLAFADPLTYRAYMAPQFFSVDDFSWIHFSTSAYLQDLEALVDDAALRRERGHFLQHQVCSRISARDNLASIEASYRKARQAPLVADTLLDEALRVDNPALRLVHDEIARGLNAYRNDAVGLVSPHDLPPSAARLRYQQAAALVASGRTEAGVAALISLAGENTSIWEVYVDLAEFALTRDDRQAALVLLQTAVQQAPLVRRAALGAAMLQTECGEYEQALLSLGPYLRQHPNDDDALALLRRILGLAPELTPGAWIRLLADLRHTTRVE